MRLRAKVATVTGLTEHFNALVVNDKIGAEPIEDPVLLEISTEDGAFFLFRMDRSGVCISDTWHQSLEEAMAQAKKEYMVERGDWLELSV